MNGMRRRSSLPHIYCCSCYSALYSYEEESVTRSLNESSEVWGCGRPQRKLIRPGFKVHRDERPLGIPALYGTVRPLRIL